MTKILPDHVRAATAPMLCAECGNTALHARPLIKLDGEVSDIGYLLACAHCGDQLALAIALVDVEDFQATVAKIAGRDDE